LELSWASLAVVELTVTRLGYSVVNQQEQDCLALGQEPEELQMQKAALRHIDSMDQ